MKKRLLSTTLAVVLLLSLLPSAASALLIAPNPSAATTIAVTVDGNTILFEQPPVVLSGRTLADIEPVADAIGAKIVFNEFGTIATLTRAGTVIVLTEGSDIAVVNGNDIIIDRPPETHNGRLLLPLKFIAQTFSQNIVYDAKTISAVITEDTSFDHDSKTAAWILGCGAILAEVNDFEPYQLGMLTRTAENVEKIRSLLHDEWYIDTREELLDKITELQDAATHAAFAKDYAEVKNLSDAEIKELAEQSLDADIYLWPFIRATGDKWGETGVAAFDLFRVTHIASWGYTAGLLELSETYAFADKSAKELKTLFKSWDEAIDNYLDGYVYWSRSDSSAEDSDYNKRVDYYKKLKTGQTRNGPLFDDSVWE